MLTPIPFFSRTISLWNSLPFSIASAPAFNCFKRQLFLCLVCCTLSRPFFVIFGYMLCYIVDSLVHVSCAAMHKCIYHNNIETSLLFIGIHVGDACMHAST